MPHSFLKIQVARNLKYSGLQKLCCNSSCIYTNWLPLHVPISVPEMLLKTAAKICERIVKNALKTPNKITKSLTTPLRPKVLSTSHPLEKKNRTLKWRKKTQVRMLQNCLFQHQLILLVLQSLFPRYGLLGAYSTKQTWRNKGGKIHFKWFHELELNTTAFITQKFPAHRARTQPDSKLLSHSSPA